MARPSGKRQTESPTTPGRSSVREAAAARRQPAGAGPQALPTDALAAVPPDQILRLQRQLGNARVQRLLRPPAGIQRWENGEGVAELEAFINGDQVTVTSLQTMLHSLENNIGADAVTVHTGVGTTMIPVDAATDLRTKVVAKLKRLLMEGLHRERTKLTTAMAVISDDSDRHAYMRKLHATDQVWLKQLRAISSGSNWQHPDAAVQDAVLAAFQLDAVISAEGDLDSPEGAQKAAVKATQMSPKGDWCGMFVSTNYMRATLDKDLKAGLFHVKNVEDYFTYRYDRNRKRIKKWIYADGAWQELQTYHTLRGAERSWIDAAQIKDESALDIRSGDVVLIDHEADGRPNHIVMVHSYNPHTRMLITIGGNDSGFEVDQRADPKPPKGESESRREERELAEAATGRSLKKGGTRYEDTGKKRVGVGVKDLDARKLKVYGIGRPSIVDFEDHIYSPARKMPVAVPEEFAPAS